MATVNKYNAKHLRTHSGVPYGNAWVDVFNLTTNASGVLAGSDQTTAIIQTNVVRLGVIPAGTKVLDAVAIVSDAFTTSATADIGFQYVDGTDVTAFPQDDNCWFDNLALDSAALTRKTLALAPQTLSKDAYVILTLAGADLAAVGIIDIILTGQVVGAL